MKDGEEIWEWKVEEDWWRVKSHGRKFQRKNIERYALWDSEKYIHFQGGADEEDNDRKLYEESYRLIYESVVFVYDMKETVTIMYCWERNEWKD